MACASRRWQFACYVGLSLLLMSAAPLEPVLGQEETPPRRASGKEARTVEVEFAASGHMQLVLDADQLEIGSPYGKLTVPVAEIETIELATRLTPALQKQLDAAIVNLGSVDFAVRERAVKELLALQEKAYPALVLATKHADLEIARRSQELVVRLRDSVAAEKLVVREYDVITTAHSKISGRICADELSVETSQFGPQKLKLTDVRNIRSHGIKAPVEDVAQVEPDPGSLYAVSDMIGKTFAYKVTGRAGGVIWGTGVYTTDSALAVAAVHAGALKAGETGVVRVTIIAPPPAFAGSTQNGITSSPYGSFPGAYQVLVPKR